MKEIPSPNTNHRHTSPANMKYKERETLLDSLLARDGFPSDIRYRSDAIRYQRRSTMAIIAKALNRLLRTKLVYQKYWRKTITQIKESKEVYSVQHPETNKVPQNNMDLHPLSKERSEWLTSPSCRTIEWCTLCGFYLHYVFCYSFRCRVLYNYTIII